MKPTPLLVRSGVARRSWMKAAAGVAAAGLLPRRVAAQPRTAAGAATAGSLVASDSAAIAGTTHGQGARIPARGDVHLQGHSLWSAHLRRPALHGAGAAGAVDRRSLGARLGVREPADSARALGQGRGGLRLRMEPRRAGRRLSAPERLDARPRQPQARRHGLAARRRLRHRLRQRDERLRRGEPRAPRCRRRQPQPPRRRGRLPRPLVHRRREVRGVGKRGSARHRRRARVGTGQHRGLRRRSRERDDLRPVRRRREGDRPDGHAAGQGPVPQGDRRERLHATPADSRLLGEARRRRAEGDGRRQRPSGRPPGHAVRPLRRGRPGRREEGVPVRRLLAADRLRSPRRDRTPGPRRSTASSCPSIRSGPQHPPHRPACR